MCSNIDGLRHLTTKPLGGARCLTVDDPSSLTSMGGGWVDQISIAFGIAFGI